MAFFDDLKKKYTELLNPVKQSLSDNQGWIRQGQFTPQIQLVDLNNSFWNKSGVGLGLQNLQRTVESPKLSQNTGDWFRNTANTQSQAFSSPLVQGAIKFAGNVAGNTVQPFVGGIQQAGLNLPKMNSGNLPKSLEATTKTIMGMGKIASSLSTPFQVSNIVASLPSTGGKDIFRRIAAGAMSGQTGQNLGTNVPDIETDLGPLGKVDLIKTLGGFYGFTKNPVWQKIQPVTNLINEAKVVNNPFFNYLVTRGLKGGTEGMIQGFGDVPDNLSEKDKASYVLNNLLMGAGSEILMDKSMRVASDQFKRILNGESGQKTVQALAGTFDRLKRWHDRAGKYATYPGLTNVEIDKVQQVERKLVQAREGHLVNEGGTSSVDFGKQYGLKKTAPDQKAMGNVYFNPNAAKEVGKGNDVITKEELATYNSLMAKVKETKLKQQSGAINLDSDVSLSSSKGKTKDGLKSGLTTQSSISQPVEGKIKIKGSEKVLPEDLIGLPQFNELPKKTQREAIARYRGTKTIDNGMATNNQGVGLLDRKSTQQVKPTTLKVKVDQPQSTGQIKVDDGQVNIPQNPVNGTQPIIDPVQKIIQALKQAKPARGQQEGLYSQARSQKFAKMMGARSRVGGEKGFYAELGSLKGELPKVQFETLRNSLTQGDVDTLFNRVKEANIGDWEKITAQTGLSKILGAEGGQVPTRNELTLLDEVFGKEFTQALLDKRPLMEKLVATMSDVLNIPRSLMSSVDLSAPLRQGVFLIGRPKEWIPAFGTMLKSFASPKAYEQTLEEIASRPTYKLMRENRLALTKPNSALAQGEEAFMSNLAEKIPLVGRAIKASDRAYSGFLNKLRADVFDDLMRKAKDLGIESDKAYVESAASFVNAATGRGSLPKVLEGSSQALNGVFFSPRLMASRMNLLNPIYYAKLHPQVRKEALKSLLTFAGTGLTVLTMAKLAGAEVESDPRNSDFGKIKIGNTRYDIWGGFQQYIKLASQLITGKLISSTTGKEYTLGEGYKPLTRAGILAKFFQSKESPIASFVMSMLEGSNALGDKFSLPEETINRMIPMMVQDMYDLQKEWGPKGILMGIPGIFGVGSQTYGRQIPNVETTPTGNQTIKLKSVGGLTEDLMMKIKGGSPSNIPQSEWNSIISTMNTETQKKIQKDKVLQQAQGGNLQPQGDLIPIVVDGKVKVVDLSSQPTPPKLTGSTELDKKLKSQFNSDITSKVNDIIDLYKAGKMDAVQAENEIKKLQSLKLPTAKKPKKITLKKPKAIKLKAPKIVKIKIPKIKKPKALKKPKLVKLRVS